MKNKNYCYFLLFLILIITFNTDSQEKEKKDSVKEKTGLFAGFPEELSLSGYVDTYIAYDTDKGNPLRQFSATAPYRDEFRINFASLTLKYSAKIVRGTVAIQFGDVPNINWPQSPNEYMQYVQEANVGVSPYKNHWFDGGYFLTHIGGESIIPKYNFFSSLALCTYYEPVYQSGIRYSYTGKKFYTSLMVLNGFNVLADNNKNKSFGVQIGYKAGSKAEFTYNNIIGNEMPSGTEGKVRVYNNLVIKIFPSKKFDILLCGDVCLQQKSKLTDQNRYGLMYSGFASLKFKAAKKIAFMVRGEFHDDRDAIFSPVYLMSDGTSKGLWAYGGSLGTEYNPTENSYFRLEGRYLSSHKDQKIFYNEKNTRSEVILSGGIEF